jgi:hypothetical protein
MLMRDVAHARTGDKGRVLTVSLIAYRVEDYTLLCDAVTAERVGSWFDEFVDRPVMRYELPQLGALNFVLHRRQGHGVTESLALDAHGKCLGSALLAMEIGDEAGI